MNQIVSLSCIIGLWSHVQKLIDLGIKKFMRHRVFITDKVWSDYLIKLIIIILLVLFSFTILFFILAKNKQQMIQTYSISTFMGSSFDDEIKEPNQSFIEKINDFFDNSDDGTFDNGDDDLDDGGSDAGE